MYIIVVGDIVGGYRFVGPFADIIQADSHARLWAAGERWNIIELRHPSKDEEDEIIAINNLNEEDK